MSDILEGLNESMLLSPFNHLCGKGIEFRNKQKNIIHNTHIDKNNNELNIDFFGKGIRSIMMHD